MAQHPLHTPTCRPSASRRLARRPGRRQAEAISLVELLIGVVVSLVVLGGAVRVLVSLVRDGNATQVELNRKDEVGRVLSVMQDEIRNARRVESGTIAAPLTNIDNTNCLTPGQTVLILRGAIAGEDISYGLRTQAADATWRGPAVLVRCGQRYATTGSLDTGASRSQQVVLDSLATTGFTADTLGGTGISRNVALSLISSPAAGSITSSVQVPINTNQVYGLASSGASGCTTATGCTDANGAIHYRPALGVGLPTIAGSSSVEDIFYFDGRRDDYTLRDIASSSSTGSCTRSSCTVVLGGNSITFTNGDVLVFRDIQIRL